MKLLLRRASIAGSLCALVAASCSRERSQPPSAQSLVSPSALSSTRPSAGSAPVASTAPSANDTPVAELLPPLTADWLERLESPEGQVVFVAPPAGASAPRPVIVAIHGAGDRPDWACGGWRLGSRAFAFVVCPQGLPMSARTYGWASERAISRGIDVALGMVRKRYGAYVSSAPAVYAGFSQGANLAAPVLLAKAAEVPAVVLAEGGYETTVDHAWARRYRAGGGQRVLMVCGTGVCFKHAKRATRVLEDAGLGAATAGDPRAGHNLNEQMQRALLDAWPSFVKGLPGWEEFPLK